MVAEGRGRFENEQCPTLQLGGDKAWSRYGWALDTRRIGKCGCDTEELFRVLNHQTQE